jgi:hypothetical protein
VVPALVVAENSSNPVNQKYGAFNMGVLNND